MNPINVFMALVSQRHDVMRLWSLYQKNKADNTEMIDLAREVGGAIGLLEQKADDNPVPSALRKYSTKWVQESLNTLGADLEPDGELGGEHSATREAVRKFQKDNKLHVDGSPGVQTVAVLEAKLTPANGG
jgi:peptidoglycan hydrolase-like protein with peptidoglycan-binding domain